MARAKKKKKTTKRRITYINKNKLIPLSKKTIELDWIMTLLMLILVLLVVIGWSIFQYFNLQSTESEIETNIAPSRSLINEVKMDRVFTKYDGRTERFNRLIQNFEFSAVAEKRRELESQ